jgi:hypothetical protein
LLPETLTGKHIDAQKTYADRRGSDMLLSFVRLPQTIMHCFRAKESNGRILYAYLRDMLPHHLLHAKSALHLGGSSVLLLTILCSIFFQISMFQYLIFFRPLREESFPSAMENLPCERVNL